MEYQQLRMFEDEDKPIEPNIESLVEEIKNLRHENKSLRKAVEETKVLKKQVDNVRRGLFARHAELIKIYSQTMYELETLKRDFHRNGYSSMSTSQFQQDFYENKIVQINAL